MNPTQQTPLPVIATVSRLVTKVVDRVTGDRSDYPLLVTCVVQRALSHLGIQTNIFYGQAAWIEIMEDQTPLWVGCWGDHTHFWNVTPHGEIVDLTTSVSYRKKAHQNPAHRPKYSPPLVWSNEIPRFIKYVPEGLAEVELDSDRDQRWYDLCVSEVLQKLTEIEPNLKKWTESAPTFDLDFPDEPLIVSGKRLLDDGAETFKHYDRALKVHGIPEGPL